jgi:hypothetical protein
MYKLKGETSPALILVMLLLVIVVAFMGVFAWQQMQLAIRAVPAVKYEGEFNAVGKAKDQLESPFYSHFDIYPVEWSDSTQKIAGAANMSIDTMALGSTWQLDLYVDISDPVRSFKIEFKPDETGNITSKTLKLKEVSLWDYDKGIKIQDIPIENNGVNYRTGVLDGKEYVIRFRWEAVSSIDVPVKNTIGFISGKLDTEGDRNTFSNFEVYAV